MANSTKGIIAVLIAVVIWASTYSISKIGLETIPPITLVLARSIIACIFLYILIIKNRETNNLVKLFKNYYKETFILGLTGIFLQNGLSTLGLKLGATSGLAAVIVNSAPLFILVLAVFYLAEKLTLNKILGMFLGFIGMLLIVLPQEGIGEIFASKVFLGNLVILGAAIGWAIYSVANKKISKKFSPLVLTLGAYVMATLLLIPTAFIFETPKVVFSLGILSWLIIFYLGIFASGVAFLFWNYSIIHLEVSKAAVYLYLIPVLAIFTGIFFLHETFTLINLLGTIFVLGGIILTERKK
ncbi:DMT family transporter [Candidatus Gottesmanbacteria bacterium]|nr:DMT family transporter [Candidatus Gottesmanbacteria bacterium]